MKIVVQRGDLINREDIKKLLKILPPNISKTIETFVVYASNETIPAYHFNEKAKVFAFHSPQNSQLTRIEAQSGIAVHLLAAIELGHSPEKLSSTILQKSTQRWIELCGKTPNALI